MQQDRFNQFKSRVDDAYEYEIIHATNLIDAAKDWLEAARYIYKFNRNMTSWFDPDYTKDIQGALYDSFKRNTLKQIDGATQTLFIFTLKKIDQAATHFTDELREIATLIIASERRDLANTAIRTLTDINTQDLDFIEGYLLDLSSSPENEIINPINITAPTVTPKFMWHESQERLIRLTERLYEKRFITNKDCFMHYFTITSDDDDTEIEVEDTASNYNGIRWDTAATTLTHLFTELWNNEIITKDSTNWITLESIFKNRNNAPFRNLRQTEEGRPPSSKHNEFIKEIVEEILS